MATLTHAQQLEALLPLYITADKGRSFKQYLKARPALSLFYAFDEMSNSSPVKPGIIVPQETLRGDKFRWQYQVETPSARGIDARNGSRAELTRDYNEFIGINYAEISPSTYDVDTSVRDLVMKGFQSSSKAQAGDIMSFASVVMSSLWEGALEKVYEDLIPTSDNLAPSDTGSTLTGERTQSSITAIGRWLQTGQSGNAQGSSTSYEPIDGFEIGTNSNLQAVNWGTHSSAATFTTEDYNKNIRFPLGYRGSNPPVALCDAEFLAWLINDLEGSVQIGQKVGILDYGITGVRLYDGTVFINDRRLDTLNNGTNKREILFMQPDVWRFGLSDMDGGPLSEAKVQVYTNPDVAAMTFMAMTYKALLVCTAPRLNGRIYNVTHA